MVKITQILIMTALLTVGTSLYGNKKTFYFPKNTHALGLALGSEIGINYKRFFNKKEAYSFTFAQKSSNSGERYEYFHIDKLFHNHTLFSHPAFSFYYGLGAVGKTGGDDNRGYGARFPFGTTYLLKNFPMDFFAEAAPSVVVSPESEINFSFFLGARIWF